MTATTEIRTPTVPGIDGIRAVAVLLVLAFHSTDGHPLRGGYVGVDVFFVLSGFLITRQLISTPVDLRRFLARRLARLWPALLVMTAFVAVATAGRGGVPLAVLIAPLYVLNELFAHNVQVGDANLISHTWSLAIEVQFYLGWALLVRAIRPQRLLTVTVLLALGSLALRAFYVLVLDDATLAYFATESRLDALFLGASVAVIAQRRVPTVPPLAGWLLVGVAAVAFPFASAGALLIATPLAAAGSAVLLCTVLRRGRATRILAAPPMVNLGLRSYSLYLWHFPIFALLQNHGPLRGIALVVVEWTLALLATEGSYRMVERPARARLYALIGTRRPLARSVQEQVARGQ